MKRVRKRFVSLLLSLVMVLGLIPTMPMKAVKANGSGDTWSDPILISTMDELIEELSKDTSEEQVKYYRLTQDVSYDTRLEKILTQEWKPNEEDAAKLDYATLSQCVLGRGKKNLELMGHDVHYKNNMNNGNYFDKSSEWNFGKGWKKTDSLTFFYLPEGANLTVSNTSRNRGQIWYDGRMNDRTGLANGPRYTFTAVRDVFRVEKGAELTLNNTDVKAGRNRKIWMLNSFYISKQSETNLIASSTWLGYAYEQIYGSCVVANGGKVTINGGLFDGRGGERDGYNVIGGDKEYYDWAAANEPYYFTTKNMIDKFLTNTGRKAAVQIAGEGSEVIINDGEFWGNGGANAIGINTLSGYGNVEDYKLEIHAGTFDTSKTDKERLPDHCSKMSGNGIFYTVAEDFNMWGDCRITRDTPRGYIGFRAKDGKGNPVVDLSKSRIYVDDMEPEDEITSTDDADFYYKSDSDTIIIQPKEKDTFFSNTENAFGQKAFVVYATDSKVQNMIGASMEGGNKTLKYDRDQGTLLWYTAESMYDFTDQDNFYLKQSVNANCTWTLYEVTLNSDNTIKSIGTTTTTATPTLTYVKDGKLLYVFRCELDNWQKKARSSYEWKQDPKVHYYMRASATESFATSKHTLTTQMDNSDRYNYGQAREFAGGLQIDYQVSFQNNLNHPEFAVEYANARYGDTPKITLSDELQTLKSQQSACFKYQWQILRNGVWEDYGNWRISPDEAALILNKHYDLLGETMRLKVTEYDNKIKGVLYSNAREVTKGGSVGDDPIVPAVDVTEDPNHAGKYVFNIQVNSDAQEYLVVPDDGAISPSRRISFLDWSGATTSKVIDNLDYGAYVVYTRYPATATAEAGKKVAYCSAFAKVIKATEDVQISYVTRANSYTPTRNQPILSSGDDFATYVDGGVRYFIVESIPYGANDEVNKNTQWSCNDTTIIQPMKLQRSGSSMVWAECEWGDDTKGNTFAFKGIKAGTVELHAKTTLLNGSVKDTVINVHVMPDAATPYKMTTTTEGEIVKLMPGQTYEPQLVVYPDTVQPVDSKLKWFRKNSTSTTPGVVVSVRSGVVTVSDDAQIGEIATILGRYTLGSGMAPIDFEYQVEVIASDEISAHAHPGEDHTYTTFQQYNETQHLQICACGETAYADHELQDKVIKQATNEETGILRHVCKDCGYSYEETIPVGVHVHELYWDYDEDEHWQNCEAEECPEENYEAGRGAHDFVLVGTKDDGQEVYVCSVCGMTKQPLIVFDANGGSGSMMAPTIEAGSEYELPACGFTAPDGMMFDCWEINGATYQPGECVIVNVLTAVKAVWKEKLEELDKNSPVLIGATASAEGITVTWTANSGVFKYAVFRRIEGGKWTKLAETTGSGDESVKAEAGSTCSYLDQTIEVGTTYIYTVRGIDDSGKYITSFDAKGVSGKIEDMPEPIDRKMPVLLGTTASTAGITVKWKANSGVYKYAVFGKTTDGKWTKVGETTGTGNESTRATAGATCSFLCRTAKVGTTYIYTVRGMDESGNYVTSFDSKGIRGKIESTSEVLDNGSPVLLGTTTSAAGITVTWKANSGVYKYVIFRKTAGGKWTKIGQTTGSGDETVKATAGSTCSYVDGSAEVGKTYTYTVRGLDESGKYVTSYDATGMTVTMTVVEVLDDSSPVLKGATVSADGITVTWKANSGVVQYAVFRKVAGGKWTKIGVTTGSGTEGVKAAAGTTCSYVDGTAEVGTTYTYTVRGLDESGKYITSFDASGVTVTMTEVLDASSPALGSATASTSGIIVTWTANSGVPKYAVFRKVAGGKWTKVGETTGSGSEGVKAAAGTTCSYVDGTAVAGTTYTYTVRGLDESGKYITSFDANGVKCTK